MHKNSVFACVASSYVKFIETKETFCRTKEFNSRRIGLGHQHSHHLIVSLHQQGLYDPTTRIYVLSVFIAIIPTLLLHQKLANVPGVEFLGFLSKFRKRNFKNRHFYLVVLQKRQRNVQNSVMHVQSCCFAF